MKRAVRAFALLVMMLMLVSCDVQTEELTLSDDYNVAETEPEPAQAEEEEPSVQEEIAPEDSAEDGAVVAKEESIPEPAPTTEVTSATTETVPETEETTSATTETVPETEETTPATAESAPETAEITLAAEETAPAIEAAPAAAPEPQAPADTYSGSGSYAVNSNNGKIHIVGACSATGNGKNAMKRPVYFGTYEEAESYSVQIAPSQDKRKCGNCW